MIVTKAIYKDSVTLDERMFRQIVLETLEISPKQRKKMILSRCLYLAATIAIVYEAWFCFAKRAGSIPFMILGVVSVLLGIFFLIRGIFYKAFVVRSAVGKSMRRQKEVGATGRVDEYKFYDEYMNVVTQRYRQGKKIFWKNVTKVYESSSFFFVYAKDKNTFFLYKPGIKGGTVDEFRTFLQEHIPCTIEVEI